MKIKEVDRTANVTWSPAGQYPIYLAAGTAAQQLDASFSTMSSLEIYELNLQEPGLEMNCKGSLATDDRFHKLVWGGFGSNVADTTSGVLVAGSDGGNLFIYHPKKLMAGDSDSLIFRRDKHSGPVRALDFNPFQTNLLASGASESEILIWDLNNVNTPMTPGAKSQPADDITCIAWNRQVQHILASSFSTRCVVWDLRKNEPIIKVSGSTSRMSMKVVAWHPEVATQMCLASEDDHTPFIQLWDLRFATSPLKTMENHQRGVLSLAWCPQDPDLLLSCGKDSNISCWNPNSSDIGGEIVCEIPTSNQWSFDVAWCPRNPGLISSCSFDGHVSIYSLMGSKQQNQPSFKVAEAFSSAAYPLQTPSVCSASSGEVIMLRKPPKWLKRPAGASFGFGGKLVSVENLKQGTSISAQQVALPPVVVHISQVVTDPVLVSRASQLENVLETGNFSEFCEMKVASSTSPRTQEVWRFLQANFHNDPKSRILSLLGHDAKTGASVEFEENGGLSENQQLTSSESAFDDIAKSEGLKWSPSDMPFVIPVDDDTEGTISRFLLSGNLEAAVDLCLRKDCMMEALLLAMNGGHELLERTQKEYFKKNSASNLTRLVSAVVLGNWSHLVSTCSLKSWKEALAGALVYSDPMEFPSLCEVLGSRLEAEKEANSILQATLCYICAGNISRLVECWTKSTTDSSDPAALQDLIEQVSVLRNASIMAQSTTTQQKGSYIIEEKLCHYSGFLASQGKLTTALVHLRNLADDEEMVIALRDRLNRALGGEPRQAVPPWGAEPVKPSAVAASKPHQQTYTSLQQQQQQQQQQHQQQQQQQHQQQQPFTLSTSRRSSANEGVAQAFDYSRVTPVSAPSVQPSSRGHLAHRYPTHPADPSLYTQPTNYGNMYMQQPLSHQPLASPYQTGIPAPSQQSIPSSLPSYEYQSEYTQPGVGNVMPSTLGYPYQTDMKPGWNDPPLMMKSQPKEKLEYDVPAPITHPLFGYSEPETVNYPPQGIHNASQVMGDMTPAMAPYASNMYTNASVPSADIVPARTNVIHQEPPKPKGPIPAEHQILHDVFEEMKSRSIERSNSMPMKRKLEDVSKKLEALYNKLRDNELSQNTLLGLHQMVQVLREQQNYAAALHIHAQIVASGTFSEISSFMPALKALLQTASQLMVSVQ